MKDKVVLANQFGDFFTQKIVVIQKKLNNMAATVSPGSEKCFVDTPAVQPIDSFRVLTESEVQKLTEAMPRKLLSAALIFFCLLSPRSLISHYRRAHLLINGSLHQFILC